MSTKAYLDSFLNISQVILGLIGIFFILYIGQAIILPVLFSLIIAILLNPLVNFLCNKRVNRIIAIFMALIAAILILAGLVYFISSQSMMVSGTLPQLKQKFNDLLLQAIQWASTTFNVDPDKINAWIAKTKSEGMNESTAVIGTTITTITGVLIIVFLLPVYTFMILFYKPLLLEFIHKLFRKGNQAEVAEVLNQTKGLIQSYLVGLLIEAVIVATLNIAVLLIVGVQYALLLGVLGALLNVIPYIGGIIAIGLPMIIAFATKSPISALFVFGGYMVVQFIDNHYIVPRIVASRVKLNALVSIVVVLAGGALWGIPGMFVSIPLVAIVKVIFDRIEPLQPWGFLLGDTMPPIGKDIFKFKKPRVKK